MLAKLFHRWLNPHCIDCDRCRNCEYMKALLESDRRHYEEIIRSLTQPKVVEAPAQVAQEHKPISRGITWNHMRRELELAERKRVLDENAKHEENLRLSTVSKSTEELEALLLSDES